MSGRPKPADVIAELVRRTTEEQGLPAELEDPAIARQVAALITNEARRARDAEDVA